MKFLRKGNALAVFCTEENEFPTTGFKVGDEVARMSITTGRFSGATVAMTELHKEFEKRYGNKEDKIQSIVDKCLERIKQDVEAGDLTAIDELLKSVPVEDLKGFLPEED